MQKDVSQPKSSKLPHKKHSMKTFYGNGSMKNFKAMKMVSYIICVCIVSWMPSLVLLVVHSYYTATNHLCNDIKVDKLYGLGLRQTLLLHQRSTHWSSMSEIANFAKPFVAPSTGCPLFTDKIQQTLTSAKNQSEAKWLEKLEILSVLQVKRQSFKENSRKKYCCLIIR